LTSEDSQGKSIGDGQTQGLRIADGFGFCRWNASDRAQLALMIESIAHCSVVLMANHPSADRQPPPTQKQAES
jgi:hypothetical protein